MITCKKRTNTIVVIVALTLVSMVYLQAYNPEWVWAVQGKGESFNQASDIVICDEGYVYMTGWFTDTVIFGETELVSDGSGDLIVAKLDSNGNWIWVVQAGYQGRISSRSIDIDAAGNIYITGRFYGTVHFDDIELSSDSHSQDMFAAKLSNDGTWLWAIQSEAAEPTYKTEGVAIAADSDGNSIVTGLFSEGTILGDTHLKSLGREDTFVAKIDNKGEWLWVNKAVGEADVRPESVSLDSEGNGYISGTFLGQADFDDIVIHGHEEGRPRSNMFIGKISENGDWTRVTGVGSELSVFGFDLAVDDKGNCYIAGLFYQNAFFDQIVLETGFNDAYIAKLNHDGEWEWAVHSQVDSRAGGYGIALDPEGNCYVTGHFFGEITFGEDELQSSGLFDVFVLKTNNQGEWIWAKQAGGEQEFTGRAIALDKDGAIYTAGEFRGNGEFGDTSVFGLGQTEAFIAKIEYGDPTNIETVDKLPVRTELKRNYPNPFNPETTITYSLKEETENLRITIYNLRGQTVRTLHEGYQKKGIHHIIWDGFCDKGKAVSSGIYLYRMKADGFQQASKMTVIK